MSENDTPATQARAPVKARVLNLWDFDRVNRSFMDSSIGGDKLTNLNQIPVGAGTIPAANLPGASVPNASTDERGIVELATTAEAQAGTDTERAVVPSGLPLRVVGTNALKGPNFTQANPGTNAIDLQTTRSSANHRASGSNSIAIGRETQVSGASGIGIGNSVINTGTDGVAIGEFAQVIAAEGVAVGSSANAGSYGVAIGSGPVASGNYSVAIGTTPQATSAYSVAIGTGVVNAVDSSIKLGVSVADFLHLTTFTPAVGAGVASTHTLSVNISGTVYRILLANP